MVREGGGVMLGQSHHAGWPQCASAHNHSPSTCPFFSLFFHAEEQVWKCRHLKYRAVDCCCYLSIEIHIYIPFAFFPALRKALLIASGLKGSRRACANNACETFSKCRHFLSLSSVFWGFFLFREKDRTS